MTTNEKPVCLPGSLDNKGTPFDPARHLPRMHPKSGRWLPRSPGRGHKGQARLPGVDSPAPAPAAPPAAATPPPPASTLPETVAVTADDLINLPDAKTGTPPPAAADAAATPPAPGPAPLPEIGPGETLPPPGAPAGEPIRVTVEPPQAGGKPGNDVRLDHQAAGELAARTTYALTGALIGNHKKATACGAEHESLKSAFASFFQFRGVVFVGSVALGLVLLAYILGEARKEDVFSTIKRFLGKKSEAQPGPGPAPAAAKPPSPPPAPAAATPARPFILGES